MNTIAIINFTLAVILGISLIGLPYGDRAKLSERWPRVCLRSVIVWLLVDGLAYLFSNARFPFVLRYGFGLVSYFIGEIVYIITIRFRYIFIREKTNINEWLYRIPEFIFALSVIAIIFEFINGNIIVYEKGIEIADRGLPDYISVILILVLLYLPFVAFSKRKQIGMRTVFLLGIFDYIPIAAFAANKIIGIDTTVVVSAIELFLVVSLLQKKQFFDYMKAETEHKILAQNYSRIFALEDNFESLYDVEIESGNYVSYVKGDFYQQNVIDKLVSPTDYFEDLRDNIDAVIYPDDRDGLYNTLTRKAVSAELSEKEHFDYYYRINTNDGPVWFKMRIVYKDSDKKNIIIGAFNAADEMAARQRDAQLRSELIERMAGDEGAFIINCDNDTRKTIHDRVFAQKYTDEEHYSDLISRYISGNVFEADRKVLLEMTSPKYMLERTKTDKEYTVRYRKISEGAICFYEMRVIKFSDIEVLQSFKNVDERVCYELAQKVISNDYFAIYIANLNSDTIKVVKRSFAYRNKSTLEVNSYSGIMSKYIAGLNEKGRRKWKGLDTTDGVKKFLSSQDKQEILYESSYRENKLTRVTWFVIDRLNNEANAVCLAFAELDEEQADRERLNEQIVIQKGKLEETLTFTNFFLDTYVSAYYVNLDNYFCQTYKRTDKLEKDYPIVTNYYDSIKEYISRDVHPDDRDGLLALVEPEEMKRVLKEKREFTYVFRDISDGIEKTYRMQVIRGAEENSAAFGFIDISKEIQEQNNRLKEAEEAQKLIESVASSYDVAYAVNMVTDSYKLLRKDTKILKEGERFKNFSEAKASLLELVHKSDRKRVIEALDYGVIRTRLSGKTSFSEEYRMVFGGTTTWHELNVTFIDAERVAMGFAEKDLEITKRHLEEKIYAEYFALFVVDMETEQIKTILNHERFNAAPTGEALPYSSLIMRFASTLSDEPRAFFNQIADLDYVRRELENDDKRTFSYKSTHLEGDKWIDVTTYVILRNDDGTPAMFTIGFSLVDAIASIRKELQVRMKTDMQMIGGLASGYDTLYYINIDEKIFKIYYLDGNKLPEVNSLLKQNQQFFDALRCYGSSEMVHPDDRFLFVDFTAETFRERLAHSKRFELRYRHLLNGEYQWIVMEVVKYEDVDEQANAIAIGFTNRDAEIRKEQEQQRQLKESHDAAEAANQSKTNFLFNMSHDIRTPMNAITGFTNMAIKHIDNKAKALDCLAKIQRSGNMLLSLINSVLEVSRIEAGKATLEEQHGDVFYSFANIESTLRELAKTKDIQLSFEFGEIKNRYVYCDFSHCMRIFVNVISNAIKYTNEGGYVNVRCQQLGEAKDGYGTYQYTVTDNGIGMSDEFQEHVFEQFSRERNSTVSGIQGTGLGMAVCKSFVELMGGTIECQSKQGVGTTFTITLKFRLQGGEKYTDPVTGDVVASSNVMIDAVDEFNFAGRRVLLVEDNEFNREIAVEILGEEGVIVDEAEDGSMAVDFLRKNGPNYYDFVLMDIQMPVMNGYEATKAIRSMYPDARLPIIALSANAFEEDKRASKDAGMDAHVAKPIKIKELFVALANFCKKTL